jgi:hypothetical protein
LAVVLVLVFGGAVPPSHAAAAQTPVGDSVTGSAQDCFFDPCGDPSLDTFLSVDAHSGPSGENPTGEASYHGGFPSGTFSGRVTCMSVSGNVAVIGLVGELDAPGHGFIHFPTAGVITVRDGGGEASGLDRFAATALVPPDCSSPPADGGFVNDRGDLVVRDVVLPTSKGECKNGGWARFGFKNQGECVAFVNRQARKACLAERATIGRPAFRAKYGKGPQHRNALRRCIRRTAGS